MGSAIFERSGSVSFAARNVRAVTHYENQFMAAKGSDLVKMMGGSSVIAMQEAHCSCLDALVALRKLPKSRYSFDSPPPAPRQGGAIAIVPRNRCFADAPRCRIVSCRVLLAATSSSRA